MKDFDPELVGFKDEFDNDSSASDIGNDNNDNNDESMARSHYVHVGKSRLRSSEHLLDNPKYSGVKSSRSALYSSSDFDSDISENDYSSSDGSKQETESEKDDEIESSNQKHQEHQEEESNDGDAEIKKLSVENLKLLQNVKKSALGDVEKGKKVRNQIAIFESLLDSRIRLQKAVNLVNSLPSEPGSCVDNTLDKIRDFILVLMDLKSKMVSSSEVKFKNITADSPDEWIEKAIKQDQTMDTRLKPQTDETIVKWQQKTLISSVGKHQTQFKSLNQPVPEQIKKMLETDHDRLLNRTRISRSASSPLPELNPKESADIFDDNDFYATLLRDFIDTKTVDDPLEISRQWAQLKSLQNIKKNNQDVERKASKGRKLRYDVHDKLLNFMVPNDTSTWHEEMSNDLFSTIHSLV